MRAGTVALTALTGAAALRSQQDDRVAQSGDRADYVAAAAAGDVRAFEQLYRSHLPKVHSLVRRMAGEQFGDFVKAVVDVRQGVMAIGGELHADEEAALLQQGARQADLWGINLYPDREGDDLVEFDAMINVRPAQGNRSRGVEDPAVQRHIRQLVARLVIP